MSKMKIVKFGLIIIIGITFLQFIPRKLDGVMFKEVGNNILSFTEFKIDTVDAEASSTVQMSDEFNQYLTDEFAGMLCIKVPFGLAIVEKRSETSYSFLMNNVHVRTFDNGITIGGEHYLIVNRGHHLFKNIKL